MTNQHHTLKESRKTTFNPKLSIAVLYAREGITYDGYAVILDVLSK